MILTFKIKERFGAAIVGFNADVIINAFLRASSAFNYPCRAGKIKCAVETYFHIFVKGIRTLDFSLIANNVYRSKLFNKFPGEYFNFFHRGEWGFQQQKPTVRSSRVAQSENNKKVNIIIFLALISS